MISKYLSIVSSLLLLTGLINNASGADFFCKKAARTLFLSKPSKKAYDFIEDVNANNAAFNNIIVLINDDTTFASRKYLIKNINRVKSKDIQRQIFDTLLTVNTNPKINYMIYNQFHKLSVFLKASFFSHIRKHTLTLRNKNDLSAITKIIPYVEDYKHHEQIADLYVRDDIKTSLNTNDIYELIDNLKNIKVKAHLSPYVNHLMDIHTHFEQPHKQFILDDIKIFLKEIIEDIRH